MPAALAINCCRFPADMAAGTYMVRVRIGDYGRVGTGNYHIESTAFRNIQIGTATVGKEGGRRCLYRLPWHRNRAVP